MVSPEDVPKIVLDAALLVREGEIVIFSSAALSYWLQDAPASRDVDLWVTPPERGDPIEALMGEMSWYHQKHNAYIEVLGPEAFAAPVDWRSRALCLDIPDRPDVCVLVPHPHDVLMSKIERFGPADRDHAKRILAELPLSADALNAFVSRMPHRKSLIDDHRRLAAFEVHLEELQTLIA